MGTAQSTYSQFAPVGSAGFLADTDDVMAASYYNGNASADMPVGVGVDEDGTTSGKAVAPSGSGGKLAGVVFNTYGRDPNGLTTGAYKAGDNMPVLQKGKIFVSPEQTVTPADPVYMRYASGAGGTVLGSFRLDGDSSSARL